MESLIAGYYINLDKMQFNDTNLQKEAQTAVETLLQIDFFQFSRILETIVILVVLIILRYVLLRIIYRRTNDSVILYRWRKRLAYIGSFIGFLLIGRIWFTGMTSLATFLGLLTAGLAIALRDPVSDIAGWMFIIFKKPFEVGDRIQIVEHHGDVIDIRFFKFTILEIGNWVEADQSTGRVIHIPNHYILRETIANYTSNFNFIWNEVPVTLTFESDWRKAKSIIEEIVNSHSKDYVADAEEQLRRAQRSYLIHYRNLTPIVYTEAKGNGIRLTVRHLADPRKTRGLNQLIWEDILDRFKEEKEIHFAHDTLRVYQGERKEDRTDSLPT